MKFLLRTLAGDNVVALHQGMSVADIELLLGAPDERTSFEEERTHYLEYFGLGLCIRVIDAVVEGVLAYSGRVGGYETKGWSQFKGTFPAGLDFDARAQDVIDRLGPPENRGSLTDAPIPSHWISYSSRGVGFDFIDATGEMIYFTVYTPSVPDNGEQLHADRTETDACGNGRE
jgi:hypothetical protein